MSIREPPGLADDTIVGALRAGFGIEAAELRLLPVGNDADSQAFRVQVAQGPAYFLKVRAGANPTRGAAPGLGEATRRAAVEGFMDLFAPGNIVDLALASDTTGPPGG